MAVPDPVSAVAVPRDLAGGTPAVETEGEAESSTKPALSSPRVAASSSSSPRSATVTVGFFDLGLPRRRDASSVCYLLRADAMYILSSLCFCSPGTQLFSELDKMCRKKRAIGLYGKNGMLFFAARPSLAARPRCPWMGIDNWNIEWVHSPGMRGS